MSQATIPYEPDRFERRPRRGARFEYRPSPSTRTGAGADNQWADRIGPILFLGQVAERMGWTNAEVEEATKQHVLLGCRTRDGVLVLPAYQFRDGAGRELVDGFSDVMTVFQGTDVDRWAIASWFVTSLASLENCPIEVLRLGGRADDVIQAAREQASAWEQ